MTEQITYLIRIAGASQIFLALLHIPFYYKLNWGEDVRKLTRINAQVFHVHTLFICLVLFLSGLLCLFQAPLLLDGSSLSRFLLAGFFLFWFLRLIAQWFVYDFSHWVGKPKETTVHIIFTGVWFYYCAVFGFPLLYN